MASFDGHELTSENYLILSAIGGTDCFTYEY